MADRLLAERLRDLEEIPDDESVWSQSNSRPSSPSRRPEGKKRSVSPVKQRPMFREGQTLPLKDMVELDRRWKLMEGTKPWTLANRIKLLTTRHDVPVHSHAEQLDLIAMCTKGLYFFSTQTLYNCQQLVKSMHSRKLEKGEAVYTQGDRGDTFYVVLEGAAVFQRVQEGGDCAVTVRTANRGVGFGEQALLTGNPRETSVIATTPMEVLQIDKAVFLSTCQQQVIQKNRRCKELLCQVPCFKRFDQSTLETVAKLFEVDRYDKDHAFMLDNTTHIYFVLDGTVGIYDPCQAPSLNKKEKPKSRYSTKNENMPPIADVPGGGKRFRVNGAVKLTELNRAKLFGEQCVFDHMEKNGWVAIAEGAVELMRMQRETFATCMPHDLIRTLGEEASFCADFHKGAKEPTTTRAKGKALAAQQAVLAAERESAKERMKTEISVANIFNASKYNIKTNIQGVKETRELNSLIGGINDLSKRTRSILGEDPVVDRFAGTPQPVRGFLAEAQWVTKQQQELEAAKAEQREANGGVTEPNTPLPNSQPTAPPKIPRRSTFRPSVRVNKPMTDDTSDTSSRRASTHEHASTSTHETVPATASEHTPMPGPPMLKTLPSVHDLVARFADAPNTAPAPSRPEAAETADEEGSTRLPPPPATTSRASRTANSISAAGSSSSLSFTPPPPLRSESPPPPAKKPVTRITYSRGQHGPQVVVDSTGPSSPSQLLDRASEVGGSTRSSPERQPAGGQGRHEAEEDVPIVPSRPCSTAMLFASKRPPGLNRVLGIDVDAANPVLKQQQHSSANMPVPRLALASVATSEAASEKRPWTSGATGGGFLERTDPTSLSPQMLQLRCSTRGSPRTGFSGGARGSMAGTTLAFIETLSRQKQEQEQQEQADQATPRADFFAPIALADKRPELDEPQTPPKATRPWL